MRARNIPRKQVLLFVASTIVALFILGPTSQAQNGSWVSVGTHPQAAQQPATRDGNPTVARYLWNLKAWNGKLYAGYGDYSANGVSYLNTQFAITPFDPISLSFAGSPAFQFHTEAVPLYRDLNGSLYAPTMDPSAGDPLTGDQWTSLDVENSNFAVGTQGGFWLDKHNQRSVHVFDVATLNLTDVWMVGADCFVEGNTRDCSKSDAVVWGSTNGGNSFQERLRVHPPANSPGVARFYFAGVLNNSLYVQEADFQELIQRNSPKITITSAQPYSWILSSWTSNGVTVNTTAIGPDLFPRRDLDLEAYGYQPVYFKGQMVYMTRFSYEGDGTLSTGQQVMKRLVQFNGANASYVDTPVVRNFTVDGNYIYVLATDGQVRRTSDLSLPWTQWESFASFTDTDSLRPSRKASNSIAVLNGWLYIGTSESQIYRYSTPLGE